jgi:hypothetical protein
MKTNALYIGPNSGRIAVSGNSFSSSYIGDGQDRRREDDRAVAGLVLDGTNHIGVSGNVFSGVISKAVTATDLPSDNVLFTGNVVMDSNSDHEKLPKALVSDNIFEK